MSNEPKRSDDSLPLHSQTSGPITPFEQIRRTNPAGNEFWSSRDFARVLGYVNYRHFQAVIEKARTACFNSGQRVEDHFVGIDEMVEIAAAELRMDGADFVSARIYPPRPGGRHGAAIFSKDPGVWRTNPASRRKYDG